MVAKISTASRETGGVHDRPATSSPRATAAQPATNTRDDSWTTGRASEGLELNGVSFLASSSSLLYHGDHLATLHDGAGGHPDLADGPARRRRHRDLRLHGFHDGDHVP